MDQRSRGIVTPEAVVLELETAGIGSRLLARLVDLLILAVLGYLGAVVVLAVAAALPEASLVVGILLVAVVLLGYPVVSEVALKGRTFGKLALGLRVVTTDGAPIAFRHAALRGLIGLAEVFTTFGGVAVLVMLLTRRNQRFGDLAAGTVVVRERDGATRSVAVAFPPPAGCEAYCASLDVSAVDDVQYGVIRSFLRRVYELTPAARAALAVRLANPTAERMRHTPPPMLGPELFLACVASAYQVRHGGLLLPTWPVAPPGRGFPAPPTAGVVASPTGFPSPPAAGVAPAPPMGPPPTGGSTGAPWAPRG